jgi:hypothetical protein
LLLNFRTVMFEKKRKKIWQISTIIEYFPFLHLFPFSQSFDREGEHNNEIKEACDIHYSINPLRGVILMLLFLKYSITFTQTVNSWCRQWWNTRQRNVIGWLRIHISSIQHERNGTKSTPRIVLALLFSNFFFSSSFYHFLCHNAK